MINLGVLYCYLVLLAKNRSDAPIFYICLCFVGICIFNIFITGTELITLEYFGYRIVFGDDGSMFYLINFIISFLMFANCSNIASKSLNPLSFFLLGGTLLVVMGVNLLGLLNVYSDGGILGVDSNFIKNSYGVLSITELVGVCCVSFTGLRRISEYYMARTCSYSYRLLRVVSSYKIGANSTKRHT